MRQNYFASQCSVIVLRVGVALHLGDTSGSQAVVNRAQSVSNHRSEIVKIAGNYIKLSVYKSHAAALKNV